MYKKIFVPLALLSMLCSCLAQKEELIIIDVKSSGMGFQPDRRMVTLNASACIIFNNDIQVYIQPEHHLHVEDLKNSKGEIIDEKVKSIDTLHKVFVRKKHQAIGIEYNLEKIESVKGKTFDADSLWETLTFRKNMFKNSDNSKDKGKLVGTIEKDNIKIDQYALKFEIGGIDSIYKYYDKSIRDIPYSFSERLDSVNNSKLFKVFAIANEIPKGIALPNMAVPRREFYHEMKVVKYTRNTKLYKAIIEKFKKDSERLKLK